MKQILGILAASLCVLSFSACNVVDEIPPPPETVTETVSIQPESPVEEITTTQQETTQPQSTESETTTAETAAQTTTEAATSASTPSTTPQTTTAETTTSAATTETTTSATTTEATTSATTEVTTSAPSNIVNSYSPLNFTVQKAMWISFYEMGDITKGRSESQYRTSVDTICNNVKSIGINTLYVHARAHGDAFYNSDLYPWATEMSGTMDTNIGYDPLEIFIEIAHSKGLSVHAWINPLRLMKDSEIKGLSNDNIIKKWYNDSTKKGNYIVFQGSYWYLNPAYSETRELIYAGVREIVCNYNVDGIHIDDYFYPTSDKSFDSSAFANSGKSNLSNWRIDNINTLVKGMYNTTKASNSQVLFGISPQANIGNCYDYVFADVRKWGSEKGYCDYLIPQVYFGFDNGTLPFETCVQEWKALNTEPSVKLMIGLAAHKIGVADSWAGSGKNEWINNSDVITRQSEYAINTSCGVAYFRYNSLFNPASNVANKVKSERDGIKSVLS